jgi:site-specific DNA-adenine methylase
VRRAYIVKRVDIEDPRVYVFKDKGKLRSFINVVIEDEGGVWLEMIRLFKNEDEEKEFYERCRQSENIILRI